MTDCCASDCQDVWSVKWLIGTALYCMKKCIIGKKTRIGCREKPRMSPYFHEPFWTIYLRILCMNKNAYHTIDVVYKWDVHLYWLEKINKSHILQNVPIKQGKSRHLKWILSSSLSTVSNPENQHYRRTPCVVWKSAIGYLKSRQALPWRTSTF